MTTLLAPPAYGSEEWLAWRRHGLGASELPSLVGCSPWTGEYELALRKRGEVIEEVASTAMGWGHRIESLALDAYEDICGLDEGALDRGETWADDRWPHLWATLDARAGRVGVEVKATTRWTVPPPHVVVQVQAQMGLADLERVDVVRVSPYGEPIITPVERDEAMIADLFPLAEAWWHRYVEGDELPPPDGSRAAMRHLDKLRGDEEAQASAEQATLMGALRLARKRLADVETEERAIVAALKASMAGTGVLTGDGFRVVWSATKGRTTTDWRAVARVMGSIAGIAPEAYDAEVERHTTVGEPSTSFRPQWDEEES